MPMRRPRWLTIYLTLALVLAGGLASWTLLPAVGATAQAQVPAGCRELIVNGNFEGSGGWSFGKAPAMPQVVNSIVHGGQHSLLLGIPQGYPNQLSYSSARQQVALPAEATSVVLTFWYHATMPGAPTTDYVELALLGPDGHAVIDKPWRGFVDNRLWNQASFDLSGWRGQTAILYFNVYNNGAGPTASVFLDDVSLAACGSVVIGTLAPAPGISPTPTLLPVGSTRTPTPLPSGATATPTLLPRSATPVTPAPSPTGLVAASPTLAPVFQPVQPAPPPSVTPSPPTGGPPQGTEIEAPWLGCQDLVQNGGFEAGWDHWDLWPNRIPAQIVANPVFAGARSMQLGTMELSGVESYSSISQVIDIPPESAHVRLQFETWTWAETPPGADRMEADFLEPDPDVIYKFWRTWSGDRAWVFRDFDVTGYRGRSVRLYFNVYNDGASGRAAMFLDEVHVWSCTSFAPAVAAPTAPSPASGSLSGPGLVGASRTSAPAPGLTVLALATNTPAVTPEPPRPAEAATSTLTAGAGTRSAQATATRTPAPATTPAPGAGLLDKVREALHLPPLPPLPPGWQCGLLAIIAVLIALILYARSH